jgi:hypothetical protein
MRERERTNLRSSPTEARKRTHEFRLSPPPREQRTRDRERARLRSSPTEARERTHQHSTDSVTTEEAHMGESETAHSALSVRLRVLSPASRQATRTL